MVDWRWRWLHRNNQPSALLEPQAGRLLLAGRARQWKENRTRSKPVLKNVSEHSQLSKEKKNFGRSGIGQELLQKKDPTGCQEEKKVSEKRFLGTSGTLFARNQLDTIPTTWVIIGKADSTSTLILSSTPTICRQASLLPQPSPTHSPRVRAPLPLHAPTLACMD